MILINEAVDIRFLGKESTRPLRGEKSKEALSYITNKKSFSGIR